MTKKLVNSRKKKQKILKLLILLQKNYIKKEIEAKIVALILNFLNHLSDFFLINIRSIKRLKKRDTTRINELYIPLTFKACVETNNKGIKGLKKKKPLIFASIIFCHCMPDRKQTISAAYREEIILISENLTKISW